MFNSPLVPDHCVIVAAQDASKALIDIAALTPEAALAYLHASVDGLLVREADERLLKCAALLGTAG